LPARKVNSLIDRLGGRNSAQTYPLAVGWVYHVTLPRRLAEPAMRKITLLAALLVALASPVTASDDVAAARSVILSQTEAFSRDDAAAAYAFAAPGIHEMFPRPEIFLKMVQQSYAPVYRHRSFEFGEARAADGKIAQQVHIVDTDGVAWEALYTLEVAPDGNLRISGCVLIKVGQGV
jgi:hypothetical protein